MNEYIRFGREEKRKTIQSKRKYEKRIADICKQHSKTDLDFENKLKVELCKTPKS